MEHVGSDTMKKKVVVAVRSNGCQVGAKLALKPEFIEFFAGPRPHLDLSLLVILLKQHASNPLM